MQYYEVEAIIGKRYIRAKRRSEYLVKWKNYPIQKSSWEPLKNLQKAYQQVKLFEIRNERKRQISLVQILDKQQLQREKDQKQRKQMMQKLIQKKYKKKQQYSQRKRERVKQKREQKIRRKQQEKEEQNKQQKQRQKARQQEQQSINGLQVQPITIEIKQMKTQNNLTYFKIVESQKQVWRNRSYLIQFYPQQLCNFYEQAVLNKVCGD